MTESPSRNPVRAFLDDIRVEHTVFALPFAYMTLFVVSGTWPTGSNFAWISLAMVSARTFGMAANRLIDAAVDARNPRTAGRALPSGRLRPAVVVTAMVVALALFLVAVWRLDPVCRRLWPAVVVVMVVYPYAKRFTWAAHLVLGLVYFMVPTAVWLAVRGGIDREALALGVGAALWVAGFDIVYACQDAEVDRRTGIHSIPADFGVRAALWTARAFHAGFVASLALAGRWIGGGPAYWTAVVLTSAMLVREHSIVSPDDLSRVDAAFFEINGIVSLVLFALVAADVVG